MCVTQLNIANWVCSKTRILLETLKTLKSTSGRISCLIGSRIFVSISWTCKKQTSVSHCSTESEIVLLNAGLRMDGNPALHLEDAVIEVLHSSNDVPPTQKDLSSKSKSRGAEGNFVRDNVHNIKLKGGRNVDQLPTLDYVTTDANSSQCKAQL